MVIPSKIFKGSLGEAVFPEKLEIAIAVFKKGETGNFENYGSISTLLMNTERYSVSLRIQSECGKMRTRITPNTDTFYVVFVTFS